MRRTGRSTQLLFHIFRIFTFHVGLLPQSLAVYFVILCRGCDSQATRPRAVVRVRDENKLFSHTQAQLLGARDRTGGGRILSEEAMFHLNLNFT